MSSNLAGILKPTFEKLGLFMLLLGLGFGPMVFYGNGLMLIVPVVEIFWLQGLGQALGLAGRGVDAFSLSPADAIGTTLVIAGFMISLAVNYAVASFIVWSRS